MTRVSRRTMRLGSGVVGAGCALLLSASSALAQAPTVLTIANGQGGDEGQNGGAGNEQPTVVSVTDEKGDRYVVVIYMSSDVDAGQNYDPWQCKCSSIRLSATAPPEIVASQVYLTKNTNTNRPCNHPFAATDGKRIVWAHGHNKNNGNTQTYVQSVDAMCNQLGDTYIISEANKNANQGAPEIRYLSGDTFVAGYYYDGNNDDHTYVRGVTLNADNSITANDYRIAAVDDNSIGRPAIATYKDKALVCASRGDNRPPEDGIACAWINALDGTTYWRDKIVSASDPGNKIYMNQPSLASLGGGRFALQVIESTGQGKNTNQKGASKVHLYVLEPSDDEKINANLKGHTSNVGVYQTHTGLVSGRYGTSGEMVLGLFEAPITGSGLPLISFFTYDSDGQKWNTLNKDTNQWVVGANAGDSGKIANLYGANPGKQGRDFMRGIGDVPNPGAGVEGGWMKEVKSFFVLPYAGQLQGEKKNALFVSLLPGETVKQPVPTPPPPADPPVPPSDPTGIPQAIPAPTEVGGCAYSTQGSPGQAGGLALFCAGLIALARRRRNGHEAR